MEHLSLGLESSDLNTKGDVRETTNVLEAMTNAPPSSTDVPVTMVVDPDPGAEHLTPLLGTGPDSPDGVAHDGTTMANTDSVETIPADPVVPDSTAATATTFGAAAADDGGGGIERSTTLADPSLGVDHDHLTQEPDVQMEPVDPEVQAVEGLCEVVGSDVESSAIGGGPSPVGAEEGGVSERMDGQVEIQAPKVRVNPLKPLKRLQRAGGRLGSMQEYGGIKNSDLRRLSYRAGVVRMSEASFPALKVHMKKFLDQVVAKASIITQHGKRSTIRSRDVAYALQSENYPIYY